ncbi:MBL fold metallo-hydrolase [Thiobacter aerophilum]|uniref:MBL fold metallo-hydrolase n=1 Tax=Thiobacter aerophilum TaxID=3121275 RepID=A0ABV0EBH6_9BURK
MRFACLGSGSEGNALLVESGKTRLLLDCGFNLRETTARLARLGRSPSDLSAILVSHEHGDHVGGVPRLAAKFGLPVWLSHGTHLQLAAIGQMPEQFHLFDTHHPFAVGDLWIQPFPVPHDAREPTQFVFSDGAYRLGVLTDLGRSTRHIETMLDRVDALVLECNHDVELLAAGPYPPTLKRRVAGDYGHLSNAAAAALLAKLDTRRLKHIIAAHLSRTNNRPGLARQALAQVLACEQDWIAIADQDTGLDWRQLL